MEESKNLNLYQKLAKIRNIADVVIRDKKGYQYKYADITSILSKVTAGMKKYGVSLIPSIVQGTSSVVTNETKNTRTDKTGKVYTAIATEMLYSADMLFKWVNDENPSDYIEVPWHITGSQSDPSQAMGSGLTYCTRYFLCNYFQIAQPETDVDTYRAKQKEAEEAEDKIIADEIIKQFDEKLKIYLSDNQDKKDEIAKFIKKYQKNSNYFAIKEPILASKLLEEFTNTYLKEGE